MIQCHIHADRKLMGTFFLLTNSEMYTFWRSNYLNGTDKRIFSVAQITKTLHSTLYK